MTSFHIKRMDCSSEEQLVRMSIGDLTCVKGLAFNLGARKVDVFHEGASKDIKARLETLNLGVSVISESHEVDLPGGANDTLNRRPLMWALAINLTLFFGELVAGLLSNSMGLIADSVDMLADAFVYGLSIAALGRGALTKKRLAATSGYVQLALAVLGLAEVIRRFVYPTERPDVLVMVVVSLIALVGNVVTLMLLRKTTRGEAHIEASWIFTSNDIKVNALVILAGALVWLFSSQVPDLIVGGLIFLIVAYGVRQILSLAQSGPKD